MSDTDLSSLSDFGPPRPPPVFKRRRWWRYWPAVVLVAVALLTAGLLAAGGGRPRRITVSVRNGAVMRQAKVIKHRATVASVLAATSVVPEDGRLLSVQEHRVLDFHRDPARVLLDGQPAPPSAAVKQAQQIEVVNGKDTVEETIKKISVPIPPPPLPDVERKIWHPGSPGLSEEWVGELSGEVVATRVILAPSSPVAETGKVVALTFDDGPWADTPKFLEVLQAKGVKAMFCTIGRQVLKSPAMVLAEAGAGMVPCDHTFSHNQHLSKAPADQVNAEIEGGLEALVQTLGHPAAFYRAPGGDLSPLIIQTAHNKGLRVIGWSVDPSDYKRPTKDQIVDAVMAKVNPGAIILMHDGGGDRTQTLAALPIIIDRLKADGYSFTTLSAVAPVPNPPQ
jgi:peptidoglycan/xylan/chitin deacetylase (PgdA/CDA1 family)